MCDAVDENPHAMTWEELMCQLKHKYRSLLLAVISGIRKKVCMYQRKRTIVSWMGFMLQSTSWLLNSKVV
jgi:hypothetical protein